MAKFVYKMQNILNIKLKLEGQEKISYGIAFAKLTEEEKKLQEFLLRRIAYERQARELVKGKINIQDIHTCKQSIDAMKSLIRSQMLEVQVAEKNTEAARKRLNDIMVERKTHEKLREHAFDEFMQELEYEEHKAVDELVSYTYHKNKDL